MRSLLIVLVFVACVSASITRITSEDQFSKILNKRKVVFSEFITPFCPKCTTSASLFSTVYSELQEKGDDRKFISIDCSVFGVICHRFNVTTFPSYAYIFSNNTKIELPSISTASEMYDFVVSVPANVTVLTPMLSGMLDMNVRVNPIHIIAGLIILITTVVYLITSLKSHRYQAVEVQYEEKNSEDDRPLLSTRKGVKELQRI